MRETVGVKLTRAKNQPPVLRVLLPEMGPTTQGGQSQASQTSVQGLRLRPEPGRETRRIPGVGTRPA